MQSIARRLVTSCFVAGALAASFAATAQQKPITVSINANIGLYWPNFVADKYGFVTKEGVKYETVVVGDAAQQLQQLIGGSIDVAYTNCDLALKAVDKGGNVTIVGLVMRTYPFVIMSAANVKNAQDLKGKKVIMPFKTSLLTVFLDRWLKEGGVNPSDVDQVFDGATPNRYAALRNGIVSAAVVSQPFDFRAKSEGFTPLLSYARYLGDYAFTCGIVRTDWAKQNAAVLRPYLRGMANSVDWLYNPANKDAAIALLTAVSKQPQPLVEETYKYYFDELKPFSPGLAIERSGMQKLLDVLKETNAVRATWKVDDFIDASYLPKK